VPARPSSNPASPIGDWASSPAGAPLARKGIGHDRSNGQAMGHNTAVIIRNTRENKNRAATFRNVGIVVILLAAAGLAYTRLPADFFEQKKPGGGTAEQTMLSLPEGKLFASGKPAAVPTKRMLEPGKDGGNLRDPSVLLSLNGSVMPPPNNLESSLTGIRRDWDTAPEVETILKAFSVKVNSDIVVKNQPDQPAVDDSRIELDSDANVDAVAALVKHVPVEVRTSFGTAIEKLRLGEPLLKEAYTVRGSRGSELAKQAQGHFAEARDLMNTACESFPNNKALSETSSYIARLIHMCIKQRQ
jgi:hypothetical protein